MKRDRDASRVVIPNRHQVKVAPIRLAWARESGWERARRRGRAIASHPRFAEAVLVGLTFVLLGGLLATVQHAAEALRMPAEYVFGIGPH